MDKLPKVLVNVLGNLLDEHQLLSWNINSTGNSINVSIKLVGSSHDSTSMYTPQTGLRGKSPGQIRRDFRRKSHYRNNDSNVKMDFNEQCNNNRERPFIAEPFYTPVNQADTPDSYLGHSTPFVDTPQYTADHSTYPDEQSQRPNLDQLDPILKTVDPDSDTESCESETSGSEPEQDNSYIPEKIDPSIYFSKVVVDYRHNMDFITYRGLTHSGSIFSFESGNKNEEKNLCVIKLGVVAPCQKYKDMYQTIESFPDKMFAKDWENGIQKLCVKTERFLADHPDIT